jgi:hypothetical protein
MSRAKEISLILIATVLVAEFALTHLWPAIYFQSMHQEYYDSVVACQKAKESFQRTQEIPNNLDRHLKHKLLLASKVELSSCNESELLKNKLASNGVELSKLKVIYLEALEHKDISLSSLVAPYEK